MTGKIYQMGGPVQMGPQGQQHRTPEQILKHGADLHRAGRLAEAEACYRNVLSLQPANPDALHLLGVLAIQADKPEAAVQTIRNAIRIKPKDGEYHLNLGIALSAIGRSEDSLAAFETAASLQPGNPQVHYNLGLALALNNRAEEAAARFRKVLKKDPKNPMVLMNLGISLLRLGNLKECLSVLGRAAQLAPEHPVVLTNYAQALIEARDVDTARGLLEKALGIWPDNPPALLAMAKVLYDQETGTDRDDWIRGTWAAKDLILKAVELAPKDFEAVSDYSMLMDRLGLYDEAEKGFKRARALAPQEERGLLNLAIFLMRRDRTEEALEILNRESDGKELSDDARREIVAALTDLGDFAEARRVAAGLSDSPRHRLMNIIGVLVDRSQDISPEDETFVTEMIDSEEIPAQERATSAAVLASYHDKRNNHATAFELVDRSRRLRAGLEAFDSEADAAFVDRNIRYFSADRFKEGETEGLSDQRPVFIVGMPRSGTTLVEQIVASHPQCHGAGERSDFPLFRANLYAMTGFSELYPECLQGTTEEMLTAFGNRYLSNPTLDKEGILRITDKMPHNFLNLGLIARVFPKARVIHCRRDAMDTCLSILFQSFAGEHAYANDLETLGKAYNQYLRLMDHWRRVLPLPMLEVHYEDMVADQERQSRAVIAFLGLDWDDRCLAFHTTKRTVKTASLWQVRQPIYKSSVARWRSYETQLAPLKAVLDAGPGRDLDILGQ